LAKHLPATQREKRLRDYQKVLDIDLGLKADFRKILLTTEEKITIKLPFPALA
jgi:hypothetical protein